MNGSKIILKKEIKKEGREEKNYSYKKFVKIIVFQMSHCPKV